MPAQRLPDIKLKQEIEEAIAQHFCDAIEQAKEDRANLEELWNDIKRDYLLTKIPEKEDYPWKNAANLVVQLMATYVMQIFSRIQRTTWQPEHTFKVVPTNRDLYDFASAVQKYITWITKKGLRLKETFADSAVLELIKLGTCISKVVYEREERVIHVYEEASDEWIETIDVTREGSKVIHIPLEDLIFPIGARSFEDAAWKAQRFRLRGNQVKIREANGWFREGTLEKIAAYIESQRTEAEQLPEELYGVHEQMLEEYEFHELWFEYSIKPGQLPVKLVTYLHVPTRTVARIQPNWMPLQLDPFDVCIFEPQEHFVYGVGVGQMTLAGQKEVSIMHCQRLDNATVVNANAVTVKDDSLLAMQTDLFPGAKIPVSEHDDIKPLVLGQKYDSTVNEENHTIQMLQSRVGINDFAPLQNLSRAPATAALQAMQEALGRFDSTYDRIRDFHTNIMLKVLLLEQKYRPRGYFASVLGQEDGIIVEAFMQQEARKIFDGVGLTVTATTAATSKEVERQAKLSLFGVLNQHYDKIATYYQFAANPEVPPPLAQIFLRMAGGLTEFVESILDDFDIPNREQLALSLKQLRQTAGDAVPQAQAEAAARESGVGGVPEANERGGAQENQKLAGVY